MPTFVFLIQYSMLEALSLILIKNILGFRCQVSGVRIDLAEVQLCLMLTPEH